jgi:septal ring factor EnvC (AmiA/AmiB activator)
MNWVMLGIIIGSIAYLAQVALSFLDEYRQKKARVEQTAIDIKRLESQLAESEHARSEAEGRSTKLEEEALLAEQEISEIQQEISGRMPNPESANPPGA